MKKSGCGKRKFLKAETNKKNKKKKNADKNIVCRENNETNFVQYWLT